MEETSIGGIWNERRPRDNRVSSIFLAIHLAQSKAGRTQHTYYYMLKSVCAVASIKAYQWDTI